MSVFLAKLAALAATWTMLTGDLSPGGLLVGALIGAGSLLVVRDHFPWLPPMPRLFWSAVRAAGFLVWFLRALVVASLQVAWIVIHPRLPIRPGLVAIRSRHKSDLGITLLANSITLTPGTLTVDHESDGQVLYIHVLDIGEPEALRAGIRHDLERHTLEVFP